MSIAMQNTRVLKPVSQIIRGMTSERIHRQVWSAVGLSPDILAGRPLFIPYRIQAGLLESAARATGMEHFGIHVARQMPYADLDAYGRYVLSAPCLAVALYRGVRALRHILSHANVYLRVQGDRIVLQFDSALDPGVGGARHQEEAMPLLLADLVRSYVGPDWRPDWTELRVPRSASTAALEDLHETNVRTGGRFAAIAFHKSLVWKENPRPASPQDIHLMRDMRDLVAARAPRNITETTCNMIELQIRRADPSIEAVAESLGIGARTLQRKLMVEATSFQECLNRVRACRARDLLRETRLSPAEIANQLGYRETNSFRRAFRRWAGMSPSQYRASIGIAGQSAREAAG
ncbi:helix-turn-helix transcriptional regulator [Rhodobium gokarnense]|uniref:AraC-like DNA-binding protein n=1 Tax=Rhodobium gokarnense TaxID=364296 RepID=A0ABT3HGS4_9HYPH|nr:AraC family transcriptional regulator [Rhodobium gokarnense]MCW2309594.1 AraC-like DNA-binding protein [Rhodobium gokarnense]